MLVHCRAGRLAHAVSQPTAARMGVPAAGDDAAIAQARRLADFASISTARRIATLPSIKRSEKAAQEAEDQARDLRTVRDDLRRYKEEPPPPDDAPLDLVRYWNVSFLCMLPMTLC